MALDLISKENVIPGYRLQYSLFDSQCNSSVAVNSFLRGVASQSTARVGMIEAGCTSAAVLTAEVSSFYNVTQISCVPTAPEMEDRERFSQHFQVTPSVLSVAPLLATLLKEFGWHKMAIIQQNENLFSSVTDAVDNILGPHYNISNTAFDPEVTSASGLEALANNSQLFDPETHIYFLAMYESHMRKTLCQAILEDRSPPAYVYVTLGWFSDDWWDPANEVTYKLSSICTKDRMKRTLHLSLSIMADSAPSDSNMPTISGLSPSEYRSRYQAEAVRLGVGRTYFTEPCFDAVWAYALSLNRTINDLKEQQPFNQAAATAAGLPPGATFFMENFTYANGVVMTRLFQHLSNNSFSGITGNISFGRSGVQFANLLRVYQYRLDANGTLNRRQVAIVHMNGTLEYLPNESDATLWPYGIPSDGSSREVTVGMEVWLTAVMYTLAVAGIGLAMFCILFTIYFRKTKLIRLTSPSLNFIICGGCVVLYCSMFFLSFQPTSATAVTAFCNVRVWMWAIGYSLAFGPVLGKMFRVYQIFSDPKPNAKMRIKDWMLVCFVGVLVGLDVLIIFLATVVPQSRVHAELDQSSDKPNIENLLLRITTLQNIYTCQSDPSIAYMAWGLLLLCYKGLVQVSAIFLAFGTRKVKVKGLNDSKYIAAIIYATSISLVITIIAFAALQNWTNVLAGIFSMCFWLAATMIMSLVFFPKVYNLYKDPTGEHIFTKATSSSQVESQAVRGKVLTLERRIQDLQSQLSGLQAQTTIKANKDSHSSEDTDITPDQTENRNHTV